MSEDVFIKHLSMRHQHVFKCLCNDDINITLLRERSVKASYKWDYSFSGSTVYNRVLEKKRLKKPQNQGKTRKNLENEVESLKGYK